MRAATLVMALLVLASPATAQTAASRCASNAPATTVDVDTFDGTIRGTLYCLSPDEVSILRNGMIVTTPLSQVKRVVKPADPVWDGAVKGAAVVLTIWGVSCGFCDAGPGNLYIWRAVGGYALLGATIDALQTHRKTIYIGWTTPALKVRVGF
jgi:hypothetical protein